MNQSGLPAIFFGSDWPARLCRVLQINKNAVIPAEPAFAGRQAE